MKNRAAFVILALLVFGVFFSSLSHAECTLNVPGPLLNKSKVQAYSMKLNEDSSIETGVLGSAETIKAQSYGCEDSWGWKINGSL